jgi:hypothetical protein
MSVWSFVIIGGYGKPMYSAFNASQGPQQKLLSSKEKSPWQKASTKFSYSAT